MKPLHDFLKLLKSAQYIIVDDLSNFYEELAAISPEMIIQCFSYDDNAKYI